MGKKRVQGRVCVTHGGGQLQKKKKIIHTRRRPGGTLTRARDIMEYVRGRTFKCCFGLVIEYEVSYGIHRVPCDLKPFERRFCRASPTRLTFMCRTRLTGCER